MMPTWSHRTPKLERRHWRSFESEPWPERVLSQPDLNHKSKAFPCGETMNTSSRYDGEVGNHVSRNTCVMVHGLSPEHDTIDSLYGPDGA